MPTVANFQVSNRHGMLLRTCTKHLSLHLLKTPFKAHFIYMFISFLNIYILERWMALKCHVIITLLFEVCSAL